MRPSLHSLPLTLALAATGCGETPVTTTEATTGTTTTVGSETTTTAGSDTTTDTSTTAAPTTAGVDPCPDGQPTQCANTCVDLNNDANHCGACDNACGPWGSCVGGVCQIECGALTECEGGCFDTTESPLHCGACGSACADGQLCVAGACTDPCGVGEAMCDGACVDVFADIGNCGSCGNMCPTPENGAPICTQGGHCAADCDPYYIVNAPDDPTACVPCDDAEIVADAPVHYWRFDETMGTTAFDDAGGEHGAYVDPTLDQPGAMSPDDRAAGFGLLLNSHVIIPSIDLPATEITVEAVVRIDDPVQGIHTWFSLASADDGPDEEGDADDFSNEVLFHHLANSGVRLVLGRTSHLHSGAIIDDGLWHHVAFAWTNAGEVDNLRFYVDGVLHADWDHIKTGYTIPANSTLVFGQEQDLKGGGFESFQRLIGGIDMIAVYDTTLPPHRIYAHAQVATCAP